MLIYVNITDRRTDKQTHQKYSSEPHKITNPNFCLQTNEIVFVTSFPGKMIASTPESSRNIENN